MDRLRLDCASGKLERVSCQRKGIPIALLTALLGVGAPVIAIPAANSQPRITAIDEGVWLYQPPAPGSNSLIVEQQQGLLVVGAQHSAEAAQAMLTKIASVTDADVRYLVLPHPQAVVAGGTSAFPNDTLIITSAIGLTELQDESYDFAGELGLLASGESWIAPPRPIPGLALEAHATLTDPRRPVMLMPYANQFTKGDLLVSLPSQGIFVAGGILFPGQTPYPGDSDVAQLIATLGTLAHQQWRHYVPLRGELLDAAQVREQRDALAWLLDQVEAGLSTTDSFEVIRAKVLTNEGLARRFPIDDRLLPMLVDAILQQCYARREKFIRR